MTMDDGFCVSALEGALRLYGRPDIFNTDPGVPIYWPSLYRGAKRPWNQDQHGCLPAFIVAGQGPSDG